MRLDPAECRRLLTASRSAVLAVNDASGPPLIVPITFAAVPPDTPDVVDVLAFAVDHKPKASTRLRRLRLIVADQRVAVLADGYDEDWGRLWWVRADGRAEILRRPRREACGPLRSARCSRSTRSTPATSRPATWW